MIEINNIVTPSPPSKEELKPSTSKVDASHSAITSTLLVLSLRSNPSSHSSLRPKRRSHHTPNNISMYPPF